MGEYKTGCHLLYIPFNDCTVELVEAAYWNDMTSNLRVRDSTRDDGYRVVGQLRLTDKFIAVTQTNPVLPANWNGLANDVMYILGHCEPPLNEIYNTAANETLTAEQLAGQTAALLNQPGFRGGIKVYACESATSYYIAPSFAFRFADCMVNVHHYTSCKIFGYISCVSSYAPSILGVKDETAVRFRKRGGAIESTAKEYLSKFITLFSQDEMVMPTAQAARIIVADRGVLKT